MVLRDTEKSDFISRLRGFCELSVGWLEGCGVEFRAGDIEWVIEAFEDNVPVNFPMPYVYPTEDGNIEFEWSQCWHIVSVEVSFRGRTAEWYELDFMTRKTTERQFDLNSCQGWGQLVESLRVFLETLGAYGD